MEKKPGLMIAVLDGLKKKGKMESSKKEDVELEDDSYRDYLKEISSELILAVHDKDPELVADLLEEAFDCLERRPHAEGPHLGESEDEY